MEIRKLKAEHYEELLELLSDVFGRKKGCKMDFTKELPRMWIRDDEHMGRHLGAFEGDKLCAVVGVYPLKLKIQGRPFLFATTGNVATLPECEGKGYMNLLFSEAMRELERMGADAARLGGARQRYSRFGYDGCSTVYRFHLEERNRVRFYQNAGSDITFRKIQAGDADALKFALDLSEKHPIHVERYPENQYQDVYLAMCNREKTPYLALRNGVPTGYLCASDNGLTLGEHRAVSCEANVAMLCAWQRLSHASVTFEIAPYQVEELRVFAAGCESYEITYPSRFQIINWAGITDALLKLKASYESLADGEWILGIKGYGAIRLYVQGDTVGCEKTDAAPELELDRLQASRLLFGPLPAYSVADVAPVVKSWLPLPLSWDFLDFV